MKKEKYSILLLNQGWLAEELRERGHRVLTAGWINDEFDFRFERMVSLNELLSRFPSDFEPDRIVCFDDSSTLGVLGWEENDIPCVFYSVDAHHHSEWQKLLGSVFSKILVAQHAYIGDFLEISGCVNWFPLWVPRTLVSYEKREVDVSFRGTLDPELHPKRASFFRRLSSLVDVDADSGPYDELYPRSKVVVNHTVKGDLNFRVFEAMAAGALLLSPAGASGMDLLFVEGEHYVSYEPENERDAAEKILFYLEHEDKRSEIAERGRLAVLQGHTARVRTGELLDHLETAAHPGLDTKYDHMAMLYLGEALQEVQDYNSDTVSVSFEETRRRISALMRFTCNCLKSSAERRGISDDVFLSSVLFCLCFLETLSLLDMADELSLDLWERFPESRTYAILRAHALCLLGRKSDAFGLLSGSKGDSGALLSGLYSSIAELRRQYLGSIPEAIASGFVRAS